MKVTLLLVFVLAAAATATPATTAATDSTSPPTCKEGQIKPVVGQCNQIDICQSDGSWETNKCETGKIYDEVTGSCQYYWEAVCDQAPRACKGDGDKMPVPGKCDRYFVCNGGKYEIKKCGLWEKFDTETSSCKFSLKAKCDVQCVEGSLLPVVGDCNSYKLCLNGQMVTHQCSLGYNFIPSVKVCDKADTVQCSKDTPCNNGRKTPLSDAGCKAYQECVDGILTNRQCHFYQRFDDKKGKCVFYPWSCPKKVEKAVDEMNSQNLATVCKGSWKKAIDGDCKSYQECDSGIMKLKNCGLMRAFDSESSTCSWSWNVKKCECPDGSKLPVTIDSKLYLECNNGNYELKKCFFNHDFDADTLKCGKVEENKRSKRSAECEEGDAVVDTNDCAKYQVCKGGKWVQDKCFWFRKFDPSTKSCHFSTKCFPPVTPPKKVPQVINSLGVSASSLDNPTSAPAAEPKDQPTVPKDQPSGPKDQPTEHPTEHPTELPTEHPTEHPTEQPTEPTTTKPHCKPGEKKRLGKSCTEYSECDNNFNWVPKECSSYCKNFNGKKCVWAWQYCCSDATSSTQNN